MKTKTIKKLLRTKLNDWIASVTDKDVQAAIRRSAIVTGGSIASLLLREDVNDYDIYFKDKKDLRIVCDYYTKDKDIDVLDGEDVSFNGKEIKEYNGTGLGAAYGLMDRDQLKLWMGTDAFLQLEHQEEKKKSGKVLDKYRPIYFTQNAITLSDDVQIVVRFNGAVDEIHKNYDFVHATNSYDYRKDELNLRKEALECLLTKELRYIGSRYPLTSIIRTKKFVQRKWTINAGQYLKIMWQVAELDLRDINVLSEQLAGVDVAYFNQFVAAMAKQNKKKIDYNLISDMVDEIFE